MTKVLSAPATKNDILLLKKGITNVERKMHELHKDTIREFKFIAEQIHKDAIDANKERIELHEDRITRLERYVGVPRSLSA